MLYQVRNVSVITFVIIPYFKNYPLITQKQSDYLLFKEIVELMDKGEHLTKDGLIKIIYLKATLNKLKIHFPGITTERFKIDSLIIIDYNWVAGFLQVKVVFL